MEPPESELKFDSVTQGVFDAYWDRRMNPKDALGRLRPSLSVVPLNVLYEVAAGMTEGARKYGRHNWRTTPVTASVYFDSTLRHVVAWWEGEDVDPDSDLHHVTKAIAGLLVLRDAMLRGTCEDDRPPPSPVGWLGDVQVAMSEVRRRTPDPLPPHVAADGCSSQREV